jgi:hypothetical protein
MSSAPAFLHSPARRSRRPTPIRARSSAICLPRLYESAAEYLNCAFARVVISIYDIQRAVADKATVPIYYESRVAKLGLNQSELPKIDEEFEAITEGEELTRKENGAAWECCDID